MLDNFGGGFYGKNGAAYHSDHGGYNNEEGRFKTVLYLDLPITDFNHTELCVCMMIWDLRFKKKIQCIHKHT